MNEDGEVGRSRVMWDLVDCGFEGCILFDFNPDVTNPSFSVSELT